MDQKEQRPKVGIGVLIFKDGKILLGKRKSSHGEGEYAATGGHLEYMESFEDCAKRETREEAGIEIENVRFLCLSNVTRYAPKHYVDVGLVADWKSGEPENREPDKREGWDWYDINNLPEPLFGIMPLYIEAFKTNKQYYDKKI